MSVRPFRFVHATNLRLDEPLWGIGSLTPEARRIAEDATLTALGHIVDACIDHRAAVLLLTGNCFDALQPYRAQMALETACERLAERQVEVFVTPGESDPADAWVNGIHLPPNVTVFAGRHGDPVAVVRDSEVWATVEPYADRQPTGECDKHSAALRIGLVAAGKQPALQSVLASSEESGNGSQLASQFPAAVRFGYLALGNGCERYTVRLPDGIAHDPGCPQPLDGRQTEANGCSLIEVDKAGQLHVKPLPTAVVRREEITLTLDAGDSWDQLSRKMQSALLDRDPLPTEKLWLVRWMIDADRSLAGSLADASARRELCELVEAELADDRDVIRQHEMELLSDCSQWDDGELSGTVFEEFATMIADQSPEHVERFRQRLPSFDWPEAAWVKHVMKAGQQIRPQAVADHAQALARGHLLVLDNDRNG